jgi:uncharacterized membrane protein
VVTEDPPLSSSLPRAFAWLALVAASLALCAQELPVRSRFWTEVWRANVLALGGRRALVASMVAAALLVWAGAAAWLWRRGRAGAPAIDRAARLASPLVLAGLWPGVANRDVWPDALQASIVVAAFVLALEPLVRRALAAVPPSAHEKIARALARVPGAARRWAPPVVVAVATLGYALYMSHYTVLNHHRFNTSSDLGIYDNQLWQALHGHPFHSSPMLRHEGDWSVLKTHAELSMYALLPFYAVRPGPETLLVLQSFLLAAGAIPIYRFAARRLPRPTACILALAYLLYAPLHGANFYDFHFQPLGAVFVLFVIDFLDEGRRVLFAIAFALALTTHEDISVMLLVYGLFLVAAGERPRAGARVAAISAAYFVVVKLVVMPRFGNDLPDDRGYGGIVTLLFNPVYVARTLLSADKLRYALQLTAPLAFVPLRWPRLWWFLIPGVFFTLLSTQYPLAFDIAFQYSAYWFPMLFPATALGLAAFGDSDDGRVRRRAAVAALIAGTLLMTRHFGAILPRESFRAGFGVVHFSPLTDGDRRKAKDLDELAAMIPFTAKIAVSEPELPHLSHRPDIYSLKDGLQGADYVLYAPGTLGAGRADGAQRSGVMTVVATRPGLVLLRRR